MLFNVLCMVYHLLFMVAGAVAIGSFLTPYTGVFWADIIAIGGYLLAVVLYTLMLEKA